MVISSSWILVVLVAILVVIKLLLLLFVVVLALWTKGNGEVETSWSRQLNKFWYCGDCVGDMIWGPIVRRSN